MKKLLTIPILVVVGLSLSAQNLYVQPVGGEQVAFALANKPKITFGNGTLSVNQTAFQLNKIQNLSFTFNPNSTNIAVDTENDKIFLYPNPVQNELTLVIQNPAQEMRYWIFDMNGKQLKADQIRSETTQISMKNFRVGTYILHINHQQFNQSFQIVKQ